MAALTADYALDGGQNWRSATLTATLTANAITTSLPITTGKTRARSDWDMTQRWDRSRLAR